MRGDILFQMVLRWGIYRVAQGSGDSENAKNVKDASSYHIFYLLYVFNNILGSSYQNIIQYDRLLPSLQL